MSAERRRFQRAVFHGPAQFSALGRELTVMMLDVSLRGALIEHGGAIAVHAGQKCELRIELGPTTVITMEVSVAHLEGHRIGLRCEHIDIDSLTHLRQLVERNVSDPEALDRDLATLVVQQSR